MNILIVKVNALGDILMSLHMIESLKKYHKDINITWVCGKQAEPLLSKVKDIDTLITFDENILFKGSIFNRLKIFVQLWKKLLPKKFNKIIIGHSDWRYNLFYPFAIFSKNRKLSFGNKNDRNLPLGTRYHGVDYSVLATSEAFIRDNGISLPNINIKYKKILDGNKKKVLLFPGGAKNLLSEQALRRWPIEYYVELANKLLENNYDVYISGAKSDEWICKYFSSDVNNLVGATTLEETLSIINDVDIVVTHDSGPLHLSLLVVKKRTISIFGPVLDIARIPKGIDDNLSIVRPEYSRLPSCSPCYNGKSFALCDNNLCMQEYTSEEVLHLIQEYS
jgi:ADP-heptose:LPS heptosyltransferase